MCLQSSKQNVCRALHRQEACATICVVSSGMLMVWQGQQQCPINIYHLTMTLHSCTAGP